MLWINTLGGKGYKNFCGSDCMLLTFQNCSCHRSILTFNWQIYISKQTNKKWLPIVIRINWKSLKWLLGCEFPSSNSVTSIFSTSFHTSFFLEASISILLYFFHFLPSVFYLSAVSNFLSFVWKALQLLPLINYIAAYLSLPRLLYLNTKD